MQILLLSVVRSVSCIFRNVFAVIYTVTAVTWYCHQVNRISARGREHKGDTVLRGYLLSLRCLWKVHPSGKIQLAAWLYGSIFLEER